MATQHNTSLVVPKSTLSRLPLYYSHIRKMQQQGEEYVSAAAIAQSLNLNPVLVRKDLAGVSSVEGKPRTGFEIDTLINDLNDYLGYNKVDEAILVGVGSLGRLILTNTEFSSMGLDIAVGFDKDPDLVGLQIGSKYILPMEKMGSYIKRTGVKIGIITVPADQAQVVCDQMVECGILAIWNFAFTLLNVPKGILVKNESLPSSLAVLSQQLANKLNNDL
ncbi:MAG: redox-sensing transcriptional repressor Rex [Bacteroidales bacterium]|nr:redox-sensing transcriptional repressor Rex [Bacteroidales bacterium]